MRSNQKKLAAYEAMCICRRFFPWRVMLLLTLLSVLSFAQKATHALPDGGVVTPTYDIHAPTITTGSIAIGTGSGFILNTENYETPSAERNVLLIVSIMEPCWYCMATSGTMTWNGTGSQWYPNMPRQHSYWFKTMGEALTRAEKENWEVTYLAVTRSMPYETKTAEERIKQPDVITTKRHYKLKEGQ